MVTFSGSNKFGTLEKMTMMYTLILLALVGGALSETIQGKKPRYGKVDYNGDVYDEKMCVGAGKCNKPEVRKSKLVPVPHSCIALCRRDFKDTCQSAYFDPKTRHCHLLKGRCSKAELTDVNSGSIYFRRRKVTETSCPDLGKVPGYDCNAQPADIVLVLDNSGSIDKTEYAQMMTFVTSLVKEVDVSPATKQFSVVTFAWDYKLRFALNEHQHKPELLKAINEIKRQTGATNTGSALKVAREKVLQQSNGARIGVLKIVIVITDGQSNIGPKVIPEANKLRQDDVTVIAVGVGKGANQEELKGIAGPTTVLSAESFADLHKLKQRLLEAVCNTSPLTQYSNTYCCIIGKRCPGKNMYLNNPWTCRTRQFCADKCSRISECGMFDWKPKSNQDITSHLAIGTCYHKIKACRDSELIDDPNSRNYLRLLKTEDFCPIERT